MRDTLTKKEVDCFFEFFRTTIQDLISCTENIQKIVDEEGQNYSKIIYIRSFLNHYIDLSYSHSVIPISKLFIEDEKRSFKKFLNKLEHFQYDIELKNILKENQEKFENGSIGEYDYLLKNKTEIKAEISSIRKGITKIEEIISRIKIRRDSYYAHFDPSKQNNIEIETLSDLKICLELAENIYNRFFGGLLNTAFIFNICEIDTVIELAKESYERKTKNIE